MACCVPLIAPVLESGGIVETFQETTEPEVTGTTETAVAAREMLEARIWRSYGTLKNAHIITSNETVELLSMLRLGDERMRAND